MSKDYSLRGQSSSFSVTDLTPLLYKSLDDGVALVFNTPQGSALLTSQAGRNITAIPFRQDVTHNPLATCHEFLRQKGFMPQVLNALGDDDELFGPIMYEAGFTPQHIERTLELCSR